MRYLAVLLFVFFAPVARLSAAATDQDLWINGGSDNGNLKFTGYNSGTPIQNTVAAVNGNKELKTPNLDNSQVYLALYVDQVAYPSNVCAVTSGSTINVGGAKGFKVVVTQGSQVTVDPTDSNSTFSQFSSSSFFTTLFPSYLSSWSPGATYPFSFSVSGGQCSNLGTDFSNKYLRITTDMLDPSQAPPSSSDQKHLRDSGDLPIQMGAYDSSSLLSESERTRFNVNVAASPGQGLLTMSSVKSTSSAQFSKCDTPSPVFKYAGKVTIARIRSLGRAGTETYVDLSKAKNWRITAYPYGLEIVPKGNKIVLRATTPNVMLGCSKDYKSLTVTGPNLEPQHFVVEWSPGWFRPRKSVPIACYDTYFTHSCAVFLDGAH
jgi:hypothetical protein